MADGWAGPRPVAPRRVSRPSRGAAWFRRGWCLEVRYCCCCGRRRDGRGRRRARAGEKAWTARCRSAVSVGFSAAALSLLHSRLAVSPLTLSPAPLPARRLSSVHQFSTRNFIQLLWLNIKDVSVFLLLLALDSSGSLQFRMSVSLSTGHPTIKR